ncbi:EamA family transporter [Taibaiella koreensis]|uniref:EamA family transporter n=1 Tax=Taibaiella koreensis TaxID=1268548 RepID=UPI000E5996A8|nr:EamA family transporter [Taibaiella koreensis]
MLPATKTKLLTLLAFASVYLIWGSTFLAISYGLRGIPPFLLSGLRFLIAGVLLLLWRFSRGESAQSRTNWLRNGITGILILTGGTGLVAWGEQYISATEAAIAIATGPFWFIALDRKNWRSYFSNLPTIAGLLVGFAGLLLFFSDSIGGTGRPAGNTVRILAFAVLALSSISWVLGSLYAKHRRADHSTFMNIAQQLLVAGVAAMVISAFRGEWQDWVPANVPLQSWFGLVFLVLFGSIVAYLSYIWLLSVKSPVLVSTHTYINPIVAVLAGWLFIDEHMSVFQLAGLAVILAGVLLTNASGYKLSKRLRVRIRRSFKIWTGAPRSDKYLVEF